MNSDNTTPQQAKGEPPSVEGLMELVRTFGERAYDCGIEFVASGNTDDATDAEHEAFLAIRSYASRLAGQGEQSCEHCAHPLYAGIKCPGCGRVSDGEQPAPEADSLHAQIINLEGKDRDKVRHLYGTSVLTAYYAGHRDARHAAAELVSAALSSASKGEQPAPAADEWAESQRICDLPAVDEAIRNLIEDNTGDNATCLVREVLRASAPAPAGDAATPVPYDKCVLGHCGSPSGCERDEICRASLPGDAPKGEGAKENQS